MPKIPRIDRSIANKNYAQNGEFRFFQRQVPATLTSYVDETYGPDRWEVGCSLGSDSVQVARVEESPTDEYSRYACQVRQPNATARRIGLMQLLESTRVRELRGKTVTFSIKARTDSTEVSAIRMGILEWSGTSDVIDNSITNANWAATPTLPTNLTYANTPSDKTLTSSYQQFYVTATLSTTFNNLALFIWTTNEEAQNDDFYITQIQLVDGPVPAKWVDIQLPLDTDLRECQRFYEKSARIDTRPAASNTIDDYHYCQSGTNATASNGLFVSFKVPKRIALSSSNVATWDFQGTPVGGFGASARVTSINNGESVSANNLALNLNQPGQNGIKMSSAVTTASGLLFQWAVQIEL